jgi:GTPase SAR1 family protein
MNRFTITVNIVVLLIATYWIFSEGFIEPEPYIAFFVAITVLGPHIIYVRRTELLQSLSGEKIPLSFLKSKLPFLKRISILGIGNVGKTTLVENICRNENQNTLTQGSGAYITNFSNKLNKYAALLDASGQSMSLQNDIALEANILIILLDHNSSSVDRKINQARMDKHDDFLLLLKDRLQTKEHSPSWIYFLLNKDDLWSMLSKNERQMLTGWFEKHVSDFKSLFPRTEVSHSKHSNSKTSDCTKMITQILKHL